MQVPDLWQQALVTPTRRPLGSFLSHLTKQLEFIKYWVWTGQTTIVWAPALQYPHALLSAVRQTACRRLRLAVDALDLQWQPISEQHPLLQQAAQGTSDRDSGGDIRPPQWLVSADFGPHAGTGPGSEDGLVVLGLTLEVCGHGVFVSMCIVCQARSLT